MDLLSEANAVLAGQTRKGIRAYGQTLDVTLKSATELLDEAIEETADQLLYLLAARRKLDGDPGERFTARNAWRWTVRGFTRGLGPTAQTCFIVLMFLVILSHLPKVG